MKEIKAEAVRDALHEIEGLPGVTLSESRAVSVERGHFERIVKTKLEVMAPDALVKVVVAAIQKAAHTSNPGDGRIFVIPIESATRIRTEEREIERKKHEP